MRWAPNRTTTGRLAMKLDKAKSFETVIQSINVSYATV